MSLSTIKFFSSLADALLDRTFDTKNGFEFFFIAKLKSFFLILRFSVIFYMIY